MEITIPPANNISNNRNQYLIGFKDISPQWFERLNIILDEDNNKKENESDIIHKLYPEINSYEKCVVGEVYGYNSSYVIEGAKKRCQQCVALSGNFSYYFRRFDKQKIIETIDEFTKHWNEQHTNVIISNT
jgi:hypothetical protein